MNAPTVKLHQWLRVGLPGIDAVVLVLHPDGSLGVGYNQIQGRAIQDDVAWDGLRWKFKHSGPSGSYLHGTEEHIVKAGPRHSIST
jgi:hypothetical protein